VSVDDFDDEVQNAKSSSKSKLSHVVLNKAKKVKVCKEYNKENMFFTLYHDLIAVDSFLLTYCCNINIAFV
jgi:hypothetical protein